MHCQRFFSIFFCLWTLLQCCVAVRWADFEGKWTFLNSSFSWRRRKPYYIFIFQSFVLCEKNVQTPTPKGEHPYHDYDNIYSKPVNPHVFQDLWTPPNKSISDVNIWAQIPTCGSRNVWTWCWMLLESSWNFLTYHVYKISWTIISSGAIFQKHKLWIYAHHVWGM